MEPPPNSSFNVHCLFLLIPATVLVSVDLGPRCPKSNAEGPCMCQTVVTWAQTKHSATAPCSLDGRSGHGTKMSQHVRRVSLPWGVRARRSGHRHARAAGRHLAHHSARPLPLPRRTPKIRSSSAAPRVSVRGEQQRTCRNQALWMPSICCCSCLRRARRRVDHELYEVADENYPFAQPVKTFLPNIFVL